MGVLHTPEDVDFRIIGRMQYAPTEKNKGQHNVALCFLIEMARLRLF